MAAPVAGPGLSLVTDYGEQAGSCGYCGSEDGSASHGMMADTLSVECYQELLDRGWRRSGCWLYYPLHHRSCCQLLTIRLDVARFTPNKEQRRVQRRWQAYLEGAPMRAQQQQQGEGRGHQQEQRDQGQQQGQQVQQIGERGDDLAGGSPKRPHSELEPDWQAGPSSADGAALGAVAEGSGANGSAGGSWEQRQNEEEEGGGKRHRMLSTEPSWGEGSEEELWGGRKEEGGSQEGVIEDGGSVGGRSLRGASPTAVLSSHLNHALLANLGHAELPHWGQQGGQGQAQHSLSQQQVAQQAQQGGQPTSAGPTAADAGAVPASSACTWLAEQLEGALRQAVAAGQLPAAAYPPAKVLQPTAKQRKLLPPAVAFTSPFPLAVAGVAAKAASAAGAGSSRHSADQVASLLLQRLPASVAAAAREASGHLNFEAAAVAGAPLELTAALSASQSSALGAAPAVTASRAAAAAASKAAAAAAAAAAGNTPTPVPQGVPRHFELRTLPSSHPSLEQMEFQLYKKYQVVHHGDKPSKLTLGSFRRFLIDSPLRPAGPQQYPPGACPPLGFGSFHQQYWLDGRLVAVGVVDVLPRCLSSKYLFWDPDMAPLSLGKLTSLREIEWVREQQAHCPSLRYYYLGFYIHTCHRMRYKGDFGPSDLLCPRNKCWVPLSRVQAALEQPGMVAISELPGALEGLGLEHRIDPGTGLPACPPRQPTDAELDSFRFLVKLPGGGRNGGGKRGQQHQQQPAARVVSLGLLRQAGLLGPGAEQALVAPLRVWWSRAGQAAASTAAFALE